MTFYFADDRFVASRLNDAALMGRDGAESTAAKAAAHDR